MKRALMALALVAAGSAPVSLKQSGQAPTLRTRVDAVTVDVNATDAEGRPVTDLTAADFEINDSAIPRFGESRIQGFEDSRFTISD